MSGETALKEEVPPHIIKHRRDLEEGIKQWLSGKYGLPPRMFLDRRWTPELIFSTWYQAHYRKIPAIWNYRTGASGGGLDRLDFKFLPVEKQLPPDHPVDISIELNRRDDGLPVRKIDVPWYGGGMSFGSVSENVMLIRAHVAQKWNTYVSTGEGGYPPPLMKYKDNVIVQVATGLFGVREETIQMAPIVEFKYAQGAKPGLGGHLLGNKTTVAVASIRESTPWVSLFSPFPFHSVYSVEDHKKHVDWIKSVNPNALISVKVSSPGDIDMVGVGSYYAGAHIIHVDGGYGGTGAAPEIAKKNIALPIELAIPKLHKFLVKEGVRDKVVIMASGGIRTAWDIAKIIALGADGAVLGTAELVALRCTRCGNCERGRGCPYGLTTTDEELIHMIDFNTGTFLLDNFFYCLAEELKNILRKLGLDSIKKLRGNTSVLKYV